MERPCLISGPQQKLVRSYCDDAHNEICPVQCEAIVVVWQIERHLRSHATRGDRQRCTELSPVNAEQQCKDEKNGKRTRRSEQARPCKGRVHSVQFRFAEQKLASAVVSRALHTPQIPKGARA